MARKQFKVSRRILFTWFMLAGFILLFAPQRITNKFQFAFARIFRLPLSIGRNVSLSARIQQPHNDLDRLRESRYQNHIANLEEQLRQKHRKVENLQLLRDRLYALEGARLVSADVIRTSINGLRSELIINRGSDDGLTTGRFVLGDNSIIGTVSDVSARTASVKLITDSTSKIAVKIAGLNADRLMQGAGSNSAEVRLVKDKIRIGEVVYADKKPGFLDAPMVTARVSECERDGENPLLWDITVEPVCDIEMLNEVAVIIMNPPE